MHTYISAEYRKVTLVGATLLIALALLLTATPAFSAAPDDVGPFADTVEGSSQGLRKNTTAVALDRSDPTQALGLAESSGADYDNPVVAGTFFSLGFGGWIELGFVNSIVNGPDDDFQIYEITGGNNYPDELVDIEVSDDGVDWWLAAEDVQRDAFIDLEGTPFECIHYVRVTDVSNPDIFEATADGYDVDAAKALNTDENNCAETNSSIEVEKTSDADPLGVSQGTEVLYTYEVTNTGDFDLDNVQISDDFCSPVEFVSGDDGDDDILSPAETWIYECSMELDQTTVNTVEVTADDPFENEVSDDDELQVVVKNPGCTLTQGYWKNHHPTEGHSKKTDETWGIGNQVINHPNDGPTSWIDALWTPPKKGDAWYQLAHQYIAARLNIAGGADVPAQVQDALDGAEDIFDNYDPGQLIGKAKGADKVKRAEAIGYAGVLGSYNEGNEGVPHCEDFTPPPAPDTLVGADTDTYEPPQCNVTVDDDEDGVTAIQDAIDEASGGEVVCVEDGVYNEFVVDLPLTIAGLSNPINGSAKVVPSSGAVNDVILVESSDVTITGLLVDGDGTDLTGHQAAGIRVSPNGSSVDNVHITFNVIQNLDATSGTASNKGIQWFTETASGFSLTNSSFANNVIDGITSVSKGGYGIQTVGDMDNVDISNNTISNIDGAWGAGIALDSKDEVDTSDVTVARNHVVDSIWDFAGFVVSVQVEHNVDQTGVAVNENNILGLVHGSGIEADDPEVNAENNWWGDVDPSDNVFGPIDYTPFEVAAFPEN